MALSVVVAPFEPARIECRAHADWWRCAEVLGAGRIVATRLPPQCRNGSSRNFGMVGRDGDAA